MDVDREKDYEWMLAVFVMFDNGFNNSMFYIKDFPEGEPFPW